MMRPTRVGALAALLAALISGCGYAPAGKAVRIPANIVTIAIPLFVNQTQTYRVEQTITTAVVKEFNSRTRYRIATDETNSADAVLHGTVTQTQVAPLTYDSQTGRASSAMITVNLKISLVDRHGKVLYENPNYVFREQYQVSRELSSFFEEESPAVERLSRDLARTLVADVLESY